MEKIHLSRTNKRLSSRLLQTVAILLINALFLCLFSFQTETEEVLSKMGSRGSEVRTIQTKLKNWGYFFDKVDGIYGEKTRDAVIWFQKKNGLTADGIAGPATLKAMGIYSSSSSGSSGSGSGSGGGKYSQSDYNLLARLISAEARGESYTGQVAVGRRRAQPGRAPLVSQHHFRCSLSKGRLFLPGRRAVQSAGGGKLLPRRAGCTQRLGSVRRRYLLL